MEEDRGTEKAAGSIPEPATDCRVLIADDNCDAAMSLRVLLDQPDRKVLVSHDGESALQIARLFKPHIAILDIGMPGLNGYRVAEAIRAEPWGSRVLLIALTGWGQPGDVRRALSAGFDHHLTKPAEPDRLEELVASRRFDH